MMTQYKAKNTNENVGCGYFGDGLHGSGQRLGVASVTLKMKTPGIR
jgi:hypothetical protein